MRKIAMSLAVIMALLLPTTAYAATSRYTRIYPTLSFEGTVANCSVIVYADASSDEIESSIKLWRGSICVATWQEESTGILVFKDTATVTKGRNYELTADVTINGVSQPQVSVSAKCE